MRVRHQIRRISGALLMLGSLLAVAGGPALTKAEDPFRPQAEPASPYPLRIWKDATGKHTFEARFVSATADQVTLQNREGAAVSVPRIRLSELDRGYLEGVEAATRVAASQVPPAKTPAPIEPAPTKTNDDPRDAVAAVKETARPAIGETTKGEFQEIELPDLVGDVSRAAGGRLLLLHLPKTKQVAVFDVHEAKIIKFLSLSSDSAKIAGGMTKMIVVAPDEKIVERWSLETFNKETTSKLPIEGVFKTMAMGDAADGPLLLHWAASTDALGRAQYGLFDIDKFKQLDYTVRGRNSSFRDAVHIRASATGDVFGLWATSHSPQGMEVMRIVGDKVISSYQHSSAGHLAPNFDGSAVLTGYAGVCTAELNRKQAREQRVPLVPTTHPKFYLGVPAEPGAQINLGSKPFEGVSPTLHILGSEAALVDMPALKLGDTKDNPSWSRDDFSLDKRVHYVVAANRVVSIPFSNDKLIVQPFNCRAELEKAGIDYLFVMSVPQRTVRQGEEFRYDIEVATNGGAPKFEINSGPDGMAVDEKGLVRWKLPMNFSQEKVNVIITINTPDGQSVYEAFELTCPQPQVDDAPQDDADDKRAAVEPPRPPVDPAPPDRPKLAAAAPIAARPADHGLEIHIKPEGIFRSAVPDPEFSGGGAVFRQPRPLGERLSPARATLRVYNRSEKTFDQLKLAVSNDLPILSKGTVVVDVLRGSGELRPGSGVELTVSWPVLPNVNLGGGAASIDVQVAGVSTK